jgi:two-component system, response regulator
MGMSRKETMVFAEEYAKRDISDNPFLALLDFQLPKLSGLEVLQIIKKGKRTNMIPVGIVPSASEGPDIQTANKPEANSYVIKPIELDDFMDAIAGLGYYWLLVNQAPEESLKGSDV